MMYIPRFSARLARIAVAPGLSALGLCLISPVAAAQSADGQWYFGVGAGASYLQPDTVSGIDAEDVATPAGTFFLGRDVDNRTSVQLQLHGLGQVDFDEDDGAAAGSSATYFAGDVSVLFRFLDSRSGSSSSGAGISLYGRFGLGFVERDSDLDLETTDPVWFGAGAGVELHITERVSLRAEGQFLDRDISVGYLSLVSRHGYQPPQDNTQLDAALASTPTEPSSVEITPTNPTPSVIPLPSTGLETADAATQDTVTQQTASDRDGDGVADRSDACPQSPPQFPVQADGCALLDGVLTGVRFVDGSGELQEGSTAQLGFLANLLGEYPNARIELHAHSDNRGSDREQAVITRARLRAVGTYLINEGVSANRLVLRSFGGMRPLYDNVTAEGREGNNRIEIIENTR